MRFLSDWFSPSSEDAVKFVHCVLDALCSNPQNQTFKEDINLLSFLVRTENTFTHHPYLYVEALGDELHGMQITLHYLNVL